MAYEAALAALSDTTRRTVFERVIAGPKSVGEVARGLPISRPAVSQHLKILKHAGLVVEQRNGTRRVYTAETYALGELRGYIDQMWHSALDRFAERVDQAEKSGGSRDE